MTTRIHRSRKRGARLPSGAVCITRPGKWGNPFTENDARLIYGIAPADRRAFCVNAFRWYLMFDERGKELATAAQFELAGRQLACWCGFDEMCHGDPLREAADGELWLNWRQVSGVGLIQVRHVGFHFNAAIYMLPHEAYIKPLTEKTYRPNTKAMTLTDGRTVLGDYRTRQEAFEAAVAMAETRYLKRLCSLRDIDSARKERRRLEREHAVEPIP